MFVRKRLAGFWIPGSVVDPLEFEYIDRDIADALDSNGGTYALAAALILGGAGLSLSGTTHEVASGGRLSVRGEVRVISGASINVQSGAALDISGGAAIKTGGNLNAESGSTVTLASGSAMSAASGSTTNLSGSTVVRGAMVVQKSGGPGTLNVEDDCTLTIEAHAPFDIYSNLTKVQSGGQVSFLNGSDLVSEASADAIWLGTWTQVGDLTFFGASCTVDGTSTLTVASGGTVACSAGSVVNLAGTTTFTSSTFPRLSPDRTWTRCASRIAATSYVSGGASAIQYFSSVFTETPVFLLSDGLPSSVERAIFEFDPPPDGATMVTVTVECLGTNSVTVVIVPTYRVIRWQKGLVANPDYLSATVSDVHTGVAANWVTTQTTTITITGNETIDTAYRYGVLVTFARNAVPATLGCEIDITATGTIDRITGK